MGSIGGIGLHHAVHIEQLVGLIPHLVGVHDRYSRYRTADSDGGRVVEDLVTVVSVLVVELVSGPVVELVSGPLVEVVSPSSEVVAFPSAEEEQETRTAAAPRITAAERRPRSALESLVGAASAGPLRYRLSRPHYAR